MVYMGSGKFSYMSTVGSRIKKAREAASLSQTELGKACDLSRAAVSQWESGTTKAPTAENIFAIADATGFNARWLATGRGPEKGVYQVDLPPLHAALMDDIRDFENPQMLALIRAAGYIREGRKLIPEEVGALIGSPSPPASEKTTT